jgi:hypothetical protein
MAKQTINNSESGLIVRGKLNDNFTELYNELPTGDIVGTNDSQTLTNKTIDVDSNTVSNIETDNFKTGVMVTDLDDASANTELAGALAVRYKTDSVEDDLSKKKGYNLLSDEVAGCESTDGWTNSNTTDATDSSNSFVGLNCLKVTLSSTTGSLYRNVLSLLDTSKHYFFSAYVKNGDTSTGIKFGITVTGDTGSAETSRITSTDYTRVGVILQPSGFESASALNIYVDLAGSSSQYAYVDAICIQEITKEEYDGGATALLTKYSYMDSEGISTFAEITSVDDVAVEGRMDGLLIGRSDVNLLDDDVAGCEDKTNFVNISVTLADDSSEELEGTNCMKVTLTASDGYAYYNTLGSLDTSKYYFYSAYIKNGNISGSGIRLRVFCSSDGGGFASDYVTATTWTRVGVVIRPEDFDTATAVNLRIQVTGSSSQYGYVDAIALTEITAEDYNSLSDPTDASDLFDKYPYHRGLVGSGVGRVKSVGKNLHNKYTSTSGYYVDHTDGVLKVSGSGSATTDFIKANVGDTIYVENHTGHNAYYDELKNFIGGSTTQPFILPVNTKYFRSSFLSANIDETQIELGSTATTYEPYKSSQAYNDRELYSVPNVYDIKNINTGKVTKKCKKITINSGDIDSYNTSATNVDYIQIGVDVFVNLISQLSKEGSFFIKSFPTEVSGSLDSPGNEYHFQTESNVIYLAVPNGTYTDTADAQANFVSDYGGEVIYELDPDSYETYYDQPQVLQAFPNGTIYNETVIEEMLTYSTGLTITSTDHVIDSLEYVYLVDTTTKAETPIDISDCTIASGGASFTISGASNDEVYRFAYRYNGSGIIAPLTYSYCMTAKDTLDGNTEDINSLHERINLLEKIIRTLV